MKYNIITCACAAFIIGMAASCSQDEAVETTLDPRTTPMTFDVSYPGGGAKKTRVADDSFEQGDKVGLFVAAADAPLEIGGNLVNNEALTCEGDKWTAGKTLYWDNGVFNAYAYYPYMPTVSSVTDLPFNVAEDQREDGYEKSDFLYARTENVSASASPVQLQFRHIMSKLTVRLIKGEDFEGEMPTDAVLRIHNTVPSSTIDLSVGMATRDVKGTRSTIIAHQDGDYIYSAIIVPQRIANRQPLVEVEMKGVSYLLESTFVFKPGTEHLVNLVITDNPEQAKIEIGGEIQNWE